MIEFHLPRMTCGHCARTVMNTVRQTDLACLIDIDMKDRKVTLSSSQDRQTLAAALSAAGYPPA